MGVAGERTRTGAAWLVQNRKVVAWVALLVVVNVLVIATPYYATYKDTAKLAANSRAIAVAKATGRCLKPSLLFIVFFANLRTPSRVR